MGDVEPRLVEEVASEHTAHGVADELLYDYVIVPHYMLSVFSSPILFYMNRTFYSFTFLYMTYFCYHHELPNNRTL